MMKNWVEFIKTGNISGWEDFRETEPGFLDDKRFEGYRDIVKLTKI